MLIDIQILFQHDNTDFAGNEFIDQRNDFCSTASQAGKLRDAQGIGRGGHFQPFLITRRFGVLTRGDGISTKASTLRSFFLAYSKISNFWLFKSCLSVEVLM